MKAFAIAVVLAVAACAAPDDHAPAANTRAAGTNTFFQHEVVAAAAPAAVWALWADVSSWKSWDRGLKDATLEGSMTLHATGEIIPLSGPASRFRIVEYREGEAYAFETDLPLAKLKVRRMFVGSPPSQGPTTFRHEVMFTGPLGGFWSDRLGPAFRTALPPTMEALARLAESGPKIEEKTP